MIKLSLKTNILTGGFYNAMQIGAKFVTPPNWICDWKAWGSEHMKSFFVYYVSAYDQQHYWAMYSDQPHCIATNFKNPDCV